jgi:superoxide reductase
MTAHIPTQRHTISLGSNFQVINLGRATWAPVYSNPNVRFQINHIEDFGAFCALAYCTLHGVWGNLIEMDWIEKKREDKSVIGEAFLGES